MNYAKTTSIATLAALLALGTPVMAQSSGQGNSGSTAGATTGSDNSSGTTESRYKDQSPAVGSGVPKSTMPSEGRNNSMNPGEAKAAGSGNSDDGRRDCTNKQTPC
jgi:hypothetical protein